MSLIHWAVRSVARRLVPNGLAIIFLLMLEKVWIAYGMKLTVDELQVPLPINILLGTIGKTGQSSKIL